MSPEIIGRAMMILGALIAAVGAALYFGGRFLPLGDLPGDFHWSNGNFSVHFPLVTCLVISGILSFIANVFFRK